MSGIERYRAGHYAVAKQHRFGLELSHKCAIFTHIRDTKKPKRGADCKGQAMNPQSATNHSTGTMAPKYRYLVDVLSRKQKRQVDILIVLWGVSVGFFTQWWFQPSHIANPWLFAFNSFVLAWGDRDAGLLLLFSSPNEEAEPGIADSGRLANRNGRDPGTVGTLCHGPANALGHESPRRSS
jgi:hypothetical protein